MRRDRTGEPIADDDPDNAPPTPLPTPPPSDESRARIRAILAERRTTTETSETDHT